MLGCAYVSDAVINAALLSGLGLAAAGGEEDSLLWMLCQFRTFLWKLSDIFCNFRIRSDLPQEFVAEMGQFDSRSE